MKQETNYQLWDLVRRYNIMSQTYAMVAKELTQALVQMEGGDE